MKTKILGLATLSLLFVATSCKNETVESANDAKKVTFKTALGKQTVTRVGEFTYGSWEHDNAMTIRSFYNASMNEFNVFNLKFDTSGGGTGVWDYDGSVMSTGAYIRYYAWYPETPVNGAHTADDYTFDYTVEDTDDQEDLIAAYAITNGNVVTLPFKHTLSQVNFGIVKTLGVGIEIRDIKIKDVQNTGTYTFGSNSWSGLGGTATYSYIPFTDEDTDPKIYTNVTDGQSTGISYMGNGGNTNSFENALMLMPQEFDSASAATLSFTFRLTTTDGNGDEVYTPSVNMTPVEAYLRDFDTSLWKPGYRYLYLFDFSTYFKTGRISFTVTVDPWLDDIENTVAETLQVTDKTAEAIELAIAKHSTAKSANPTLKIFPIAVSETIASTIIVNIGAIDAFDSLDQIRIEFVDKASADNVNIDAGDGSKWVAAQSDRVWTLTRK